MTKSIILYSIIAIAIFATIAFLTKGAGRTVAADNDGLYHLRMNKLYGIIGVVGLVFGLLFLIFLPLTAEKIDSSILTGMIIALLIFWGAGIPCLMIYRNHIVLFDDKLIKAKNVYGRTKEIEWKDIEEIKFKPFAGVLRLKTNKEKIKVHHHLVGLSKLVEYMESNTKWNRKELKIPIG